MVCSVVVWDLHEMYMYFLIYMQLLRGIYMESLHFSLVSLL